GTLTVFCAEHRICLGAYVLHEKESQATAFEFLYTRCSQAPKYVVYDNACNVQEYVLNREPAFFKNTMFLVDGLHFQDHINCSAAFDCRLYSCMWRKTSVLAEQKNVKFRPLRKIAPFCNKRTFFTLLRFFVHMINSEEECKW
ncbi:hypothetical protein BKA69DRAFT_1029440, partial [Paraphysoderma sedebokerense]